MSTGSVNFKTMIYENHPKLVVVCIIEQGGFGGETAAPAVRQVMAKAFGISLRARAAHLGGQPPTAPSPATSAPTTRPTSPSSGPNPPKPSSPNSTDCRYLLNVSVH